MIIRYFGLLGKAFKGVLVKGAVRIVSHALERSNPGDKIKKSEGTRATIPQLPSRGRKPQRIPQVPGRARKPQRITQVPGRVRKPQLASRARRRHLASVKHAATTRLAPGGQATAPEGLVEDSNPPTYTLHVAQKWSRSATATFYHCITIPTVEGTSGYAGFLVSTVVSGGVWLRV